jgi:hypothetical protein
MKNLHTLRRHIIATTLFAGGLLAVTPQAQAAHWELSYRPEGRLVTAGSYFTPIDQAWLNIDHPYYDPNTGWIDYKADSQSAQITFDSFGDSEPRTSGNTTIASSVTTKGTVAIRLKWVQDPTDIVPAPTPKYVFLKVWGSADAFAWAPYGQTKIGFGKTENQDQGAYANSNKFVSQNDATIIPLLVDQTTGEARYTFPISAEASTEALSPAAGVPGSQASVQFHSAFTEVGVAISSNIETSWKKWVGAVEDLPPVYKARNSSGQIINEPNEMAVQVSGQGTTNDSDDVWKLACLRNADGAMEVHSAVIERILDGGTIYGGGIFTANVKGIPYPSYNWTLKSSGGSPSGLASDELNKNQATIDLSPTAQLGGIGTLDIIYGGIDLNRQSDGSFLFKSSTLEVEAGNPAETFRVRDTYTINWHLPEEDWGPNGNSTTIYQPYEAIAGTVEPNERALVNGNLTGTFRWNKYSYADHATSEAINLIFEVASNAPSNSVFASFAAALGIAYAEWSTPPANETHTVNFNDAWNYACQYPNRGSSFLDGFPTSTTDPDVINDYKMVNPKIIVEYEQKPMKGDGYAGDGYTGPVYRTVLLFKGAENGGDFELL